MTTSKTSPSAIQSISEVLSKVDWEQLRQQKGWLLHQESEHSEGLLNFLDALQDAVIADGLAAEEQVFPDMACEEGGATLDQDARQTPPFRAEPQLREWIEEALSYVGCETWSPSIHREGVDLLAKLDARQPGGWPLQQ